MQFASPAIWANFLNELISCHASLLCLLVAALVECVEVEMWRKGFWF